MSSDSKLIAAGRASAKRNMEIMKAGAKASGQGAKAVGKAMADKYLADYRGGGATDRPGYDMSTGGTKQADEYYLGRKKK